MRWRRRRVRLPAQTEQAARDLAVELGIAPEEAVARALALAGMMRGLLWLGSPLQAERKEAI